MRPTPEEIQKARTEVDAWLSRAKKAPALDKSVFDAIEALLAATEPPTDEEIAEAAIQGYCHPDNRFDDYDKEALCGVKDATPYGSVYSFAACFSLGIRSLLGPVKP